MDYFFDDMFEGIEEIPENAEDFSAIEQVQDVESDITEETMLAPEEQTDDASNQEMSDDRKAEDKGLTIDRDELEALEEISSEGGESISYLGAQKDGWCMRTICQGEFSSYTCNGCIGKVSNRSTL